MQAHPQSSSAARIYPSPLGSPLIAAPSPPDGGVNSPHSSAPSGPPRPTAGRNPSLHDLSNSISEGAGLAHDAGNLLQALGLYCELLHMPGVLRPEHQHYASELRQLSERSSAMILRLLRGFAAQQQPPAASPVEVPRKSLTRSEPQSLLESSTSAAQACLNPAETLHQQAALLQRIAAPWATISVMTQDGLPGLEFSAEILERITVNLVLNAAEALRNAGDAPNPHRLLSSVPRSSAECAAEPAEEFERNGCEGFPAPAEDIDAAAPGEPKAGRIRVSLRTADGHLRLSVEDNGPGMPPAIAAAFLQPAPLPPGTARGLGHRIVHELAMATGGQLSIRVRPGVGTTFSLEWPVKLAVRPSLEGPTLRLVSSQRAFAPLPAGSGRNRVVNGGPDAC